MPHLSILIVDDDRQVLLSTAEWLQTYGHRLATAGNVREATEKAGRQVFDLALVDLRLGAESGMDVLHFLRKKSPETSVVMISGHGTIDTAMDAVRQGAYDFLTKPLLDEKILGIIAKVGSRRSPSGGEASEDHGSRDWSERSERNDRIAVGNRSPLPSGRSAPFHSVPVPAANNYRVDIPEIPPTTFEGIIGTDPRMQRVYEMIENIADTRATVLITGESGTGKSMIARAIHRRSTRRGRAFVEVACGSLPETLLESELFGHVAGAFTDAKTEKIGKFRQADGGTLFLDEIGTASPAMQIKLLRVLQEFELEPVGGTKTYRVDTRVILATNEDLTRAVEDGRFRQDLYYRINVINIELPALRHRVGDIPLLAQAFLESAAKNTKRSVYGFSPQTMAILQMYAWKGNIRELQNIIERVVLLGKHETIQPEDLPGHLIPPSGIPVLSPGYRDALSAAIPPGERIQRGLRDSLSSPEKQIILDALAICRWNRIKTAEYLGINRTTLYKKMKRYEIERPVKRE